MPDEDLIRIYSEKFKATELRAQKLKNIGGGGEQKINYSLDEDVLFKFSSINNY